MKVKARRGEDSSSPSLFQMEPATPSISTVLSDADESTTTSDTKALKNGPYSAFYSTLGRLREEFHRIGHFDDANAKLDELCKLLVLKVLDSRHPHSEGKSRLSMDYLRSLAVQRHGGSNRIAAAIHDVFTEIARKFPEEMEAFGPRPGLNMSPTDDEFALALVPLLEVLPVPDSANGNGWEFDGLNEAFGHFVQDSFRNRKEDAQYMTPPEVVSMAVELAFTDILADMKAETPREIVVADPTCGVGSFLAAAYRIAIHTGRDQALARKLRLFGQDKVERMVRLANVNLRIFARTQAEIRLGNSILPASGLSRLVGKVDLVLTNPPFGATFASHEVLASAKDNDYPVLMSMMRERSLPQSVDSEYVLLDRELALLKPGGRLLMVVPDHVVSGGGFSEAFRRAALRVADLVAVVDLPTETFAQAGTRTKTSVVYLRRRRSATSSGGDSRVFMANSQDLGFRVVSRAGASVKQIVGSSDLDVVRETYRKYRAKGACSASIACLNRSPSIAAVAASHLLNDRWTAGFYQTDRLDALQELEAASKKGFDIKRLPDIAEIDPDGAERVLPDEKNRCISVLHAHEDGCLDLRGIESYRPTTAGNRCRPGDVILSKINPRIPRICVVPDIGWSLGCSTEFAVLRCRPKELSPWTLLLLLRLPVVQAQITTLTSGTSSSHNRVKDKDLASILIPVPRAGKQPAEELARLARELEVSTLRYYEAAAGIHRTHEAIGNLIGVTRPGPSGNHQK